MSKTEIINRIRAALGDDGRAAERAAEYAAIPRRYRQSSELGVEARLELFPSRIQHYDGGIFRCDAGIVARRRSPTHWPSAAQRRMVVPPGFPREWLPDGCDFVVDNGFEAIRIWIGWTAC